MKSSNFILKNLFVRSKICVFNARRKYTLILQVGVVNPEISCFLENYGPKQLFWSTFELICGLYNNAGVNSAINSVPGNSQNRVLRRSLLKWDLAPLMKFGRIRGRATLSPIYDRP